MKKMILMILGTRLLFASLSGNSSIIVEDENVSYIDHHPVNNIVIWSEMNKDVKPLGSFPADTIVTAIITLNSSSVWHKKKSGWYDSTKDLHEQFRRIVSDRTLSRIQATENPLTILHEYYCTINGFAVRGQLGQLRDLVKHSIISNYSLERKLFTDLSESIKQIQADRVHNKLGFDGSGVLVGIIDTGIDYRHEALGNGFGPEFRIAGGYDFVNNDTDPIDDFGHGTHVAGIIGANSADLIGVAPGVCMLAIKALDENGVGLESDVLAAIEYCVNPDGDPTTNDGVDIINMSFGGPPIANDPLIQAVENATRAGVLCIAAVGNEGLFGTDGNGFETIGSPAAAANAVAVGSCDKNYKLSWFSSKGPTAYTNLIKPDILAPGEQINSTWLNNSQMKADGTSMAAPHVSGTAAILKQQYPDWEPEQIKAALVNSGDHFDINDSPYAVGKGCINSWIAATRPFSVQPGILSFSPVELNESVWRDTLELSIRNNDKSDRIFQFIVESPHDGILLRLSETNVTLESGTEKSIIVYLHVSQNVPIQKKYPFGYDGILLCVSDDDTVQVPFGFIKSNNLVIDFDYDPSFYVIYSPEQKYYKMVNGSPGVKSYSHRLSDGYYNIFALFEELRADSDTTIIYYAVESQAIESSGFKKLFISRNEANWSIFDPINNLSGITKEKDIVYQEFIVGVKQDFDRAFIIAWLLAHPYKCKLFSSKLGEYIRVESNLIVGSQGEPTILNPYVCGVETETDVQLTFLSSDIAKYNISTNSCRPDLFYNGLQILFYSTAFHNCGFNPTKPAAWHGVHKYGTGFTLLEQIPLSIHLGPMSGEIDSTFFRSFRIGRLDSEPDWTIRYDWQGQFSLQTNGRLFCFEIPSFRPFNHLIENFSTTPSDTLVFSRYNNALIPVFFVEPTVTLDGSTISIDLERNRNGLYFQGIVDQQGFYSRESVEFMFSATLIENGNQIKLSKAEVGDTRIFYLVQKNKQYRFYGQTVPYNLSGQEGISSFDFSFPWTDGIPCIDLFQIQSNDKPSIFVTKGKHNIIRFIPYDLNDDITNVRLSLMSSNGKRIELPHSKIDREYQAVIPDTLPREYIDVIAFVKDAKGSCMEVIMQPGFYFGEKKIERTFHGRLYVDSYNLLNPKDRSYTIGDTLIFEIDLKTFGNENLENIQITFLPHPYVVTLSDSITQFKYMSPGDSTTLKASFLITAIPAEEQQITFSIPLKWTSNDLEFSRTFDLYLPINVASIVAKKNLAIDMTFQLRGNYPNPFNEETVIDFSIPQTGPVQLEVFNMNGRRTRTFPEKVFPAGEHILIWNGKDDSGKSVSSGVYLYRIHFMDEQFHGKMVLQR